MEYQIERNAKWQLMALLFTVVVVGGAIFYAFS